TALGTLLRVFIAVLAASLVTAVVSYLAPSIGVGRGVLGIAAGLAVVLVLALRSIAFKLMDLDGFKKRILVFGHSERIVAFKRMRRRSDRAGYHLVGVVHHAGEHTGSLGERVFQAPDGLRALCEQLDIEEVVVALKDRRDTLPVKELLECRLAG